MTDIKIRGDKWIMKPSINMSEIDKLFLSFYSLEKFDQLKWVL